MANNSETSFPPHFSPDHWLLVLVMILIFLLVVLGLASLIFRPDGDANIVIPLVSLGVLALGGFAQKPSFPTPATETEAKATAAAKVLSTAATTAESRVASGGGGGVVASPTTALVPVPVDNLILAGDVVKVQPTDESEPGAPVATGDEVKIEKTPPA